MGDEQSKVVEHYAQRGLLGRLEAALRADGVDPDDTRRELRSAGFEVGQIKDGLRRALDFGTRSQAMVARGEKPPYRANALIHGDVAAATLANVGRAYKDGRLIPIEVIARKRSA